MDFEKLQELMAKKENPDNHNDYQGSPLNNVGGPIPTKNKTLFLLCWWLCFNGCAITQKHEKTVELMFDRSFYLAAPFRWG